MARRWTLPPLVLTAAFALGTTLPTRAAQAVRAPAAMVPATPATSLERTLSSPGILFGQDLYRVSDRLTTTLGLTIDAVVVTILQPLSPGGAAPIAGPRGLRIELHDATTPTQSRVSYVDVAELPGLDDALAQIATLGSQWTGREEARATEARYATIGGFVVGFRQDSRNQQGYLQAGVEDSIRRSCAIQDFAVVKSAIDAAIALLKDK